MWNNIITSIGAYFVKGSITILVSFIFISWFYNRYKINKKTKKQNFEESQEIVSDFELKPSVNNKPPSLINIGGNGYLNSALQGLSSCNKFVEGIKDLHNHYRDDVSKLIIFHELLTFLSGGKFSRMEISRNPIFQNWNKLEQQDSFELLSYIINQVYNEIRKCEERKANIPKRDMQKWLNIPLPMRIIIEYELRCDCGNIIKVPLQSDLALHVTIPLKEENVNLCDLVDRFFDRAQYEDYECEKKECRGLKAYRHTKLVKPLPPTICVHLQRAYWNGYEMVKIDNQIEFSNKLEIRSKFCSTRNYSTDAKDSEEYAMDITPQTDNANATNTGVEPQVADGAKEKASENAKIELSTALLLNTSPGNLSANTSTPSDIIESQAAAETEIQYVKKAFASNNANPLTDIETEMKSTDNTRSEELSETFFLTSVIVHHGSVDGGHYSCYKCVNGQWFLTDDSSIVEVREEDVLRCKAYILFYEKDE